MLEHPRAGQIWHMQPADIGGRCHRIASCRLFSARWASARAFKTASFLLLAVVLAVQALPAQTSDDFQSSNASDHQASFAPLTLSITGAGKIFPYYDGQMLQTGRRYVMVAVPDRGYVFKNWTSLNIFTFVLITIDPLTGESTTETSTIISPVADCSREPFLSFTVQSAKVVVDIPGAVFITQSYGWQANFAPLKRP